MVEGNYFQSRCQEHEKEKFSINIFDHGAFSFTRLVQSSYLLLMGGYGFGG